MYGHVIFVVFLTYSSYGMKTHVFWLTEFSDTVKLSSTRLNRYIWDDNR